MVNLGELIQPAKLVKCGDGKYPVLSMTMHNGLVFQDDKFNKEIASNDKTNYKIVFRNQLVVSFPIDEGVLAAQRITDAGIVSPAYAIWDIDQKKIIPEYLERALRCERALQYYRANLRGSTARRRSLPTPILLAFEVPLPSLDEQQKVLEIIHTVEKVEGAYSEEMRQFDLLVKARFVEMFGNENNSKGWNIINVEEVADVQVGVVIKPSQYYTDAKSGIKAFRSLNIGEGYIKNNDWVYFTPEGHEKNLKSILKKNDLIVVRSGAPGTACVVTDEYVGYNAIDIIIAHPNCEKVNPYFLCMYTNMPHGKKQIEEGTGGAAQQHFNVGKYNKLQLMLPPMDVQNEFVAFFEQVDKSKFVVQKSLEEVQLLFDSLMQEYFG